MGTKKDKIVNYSLFALGAVAGVLAHSVVNRDSGPPHVNTGHVIR